MFKNKKLFVKSALDLHCLLMSDKKEVTLKCVKQKSLHN